MQEVKMQGFEDGTLSVALSGEIDFGNAENFFASVMESYEANAGDICFDCKELSFIDSTTLGTFVKIMKRVKADGYKVKLTNLQPKIKKLFVICALDSVMDIA